MSQEIEQLTKNAMEYSIMLQRLHKEISTIIVGQDKIIEKLILALLSQGHVLLEGVPGLAKTLLVQTVSDCINSKFVRLQFTPDVFPAHIATKIYDHNSGSFKTIKGPIFSNFILADEYKSCTTKGAIGFIRSNARKTGQHSRRNIPIRKTIFCNGYTKSYRIRGASTNFQNLEVRSFYVQTFNFISQ